MDLRVICWPTHPTVAVTMSANPSGDTAAIHREAAESNVPRGARYPHVPLRAVTAFNTFLGYLTDHAQTTQLAIISAQHTCELSQLFGAGGAVALSHSDFSLLVTR